MLIITTIYCTQLEQTKQAKAGAIVEKSLSQPQDPERKLVIVYAGTNRAVPDSSV